MEILSFYVFMSKTISIVLHEKYSLILFKNSNLSYFIEREKKDEKLSSIV